MASFGAGSTSSTGCLATRCGARVSAGCAVMTGTSSSRGPGRVLGVVGGSSWAEGRPSAEAGNGQPGVAGGGGALTAYGRLDEAVGPVCGDEHLAVVLQPERREVDEEVVLVGRRELD